MTCVVFSVLLIVCAAIVFRVKGQDYIEEILTAQSVTSIDFDFSWSFYLCMYIFFSVQRRNSFDKKTLGERNCSKPEFISNLQIAHRHYCHY